jgi:ankyrin repeat protein
MLALAGCDQGQSGASAGEPVARETATGTKTPPAAPAAAMESSAPATADAAKPAAAPTKDEITAKKDATRVPDAISAGAGIGTTRTEGDMPVVPQVQPVGETRWVICEPERLDLGDIATNDAKSGTVMLRNTGPEPRTVLDCKTSCGCTTANCQKGKVLAPGEEMEVDIKLSGGARAQKLTKTVTFLVSDQAPIQLQVSGQAVEFVTVEPTNLSPEQNPDGRITLKAIDDTPFRVKSVYPPVIAEEDLPQETATEHVITLEWDTLKESGHRSTKLLFTLDHPRCNKAMAILSPTIWADQMERSPGTTNPPVQASRPEYDLDALLQAGKSDEILKLMAEGKIEMNVADRSNQTPLIKAARWGRPDILKAFLDEGADLAVGDKIARTPLMYACQSKNLECVQILLDAGADIEARDQIGNTPLCWAAAFGTGEIVQELLDAGAQVEVSGALTGFTPLIWAAGFGDAKSIELLIKAGANLEARDVLQGATPLMNAVRTGGLDNTKALLDAGANIEARDTEGKTAILVAASNAGPDAALVQLLIDAGADLYALSVADESILDLAAKRTDLRAEEVAKLLESVVDKAKIEAAKAAKKAAEGQ